ncbi:MAG: DUF4369 domain-containing protein [Flavobacteriaceae bacterium]|jgi:hypothetical protein|nr:DUF4369 domain-containing protein [Flavobacteriaceae bacterium]
MNKLLVVLAALSLISCKKDNVIEITTKDIPNDTKVEILTSEIGNPMPTVVASGVIKDGKVEIENPFKEFDEGYLTIGEDKRTNVFFVAEPGRITVDITKDKPTETVIGGTENNEKLQKLQTESKSLTEKLMNFMKDHQMELGMLSQSNKPEDKATLDKLQGEFNGYVDQIKVIFKKYQDQNKNSEFGLMLFYQQMMSQQDGFDKVKEEFEKFSPELKASKIGKKVSTMLEMTQTMNTPQLPEGAGAEQAAAAGEQAHNHAH